MQCPRCQDPLLPGKIGEVPVYMCGGCAGILVDIMKNIPMLQALGSALTDADLAEKQQPFEEDQGPRHCPKCTQPMDRFDYMDAGEVTLDRCSADRLLFFDVEEVTAASVLLLRTRGRLNARREEQETHIAELEQIGNRALDRMRRSIHRRFRR